MHLCTPKTIIVTQNMKRSCAHINRNSTRSWKTDTDDRMRGRARVSERGRRRRTVRWVRGNPIMETKNTRVHVRHVKEDTS